MIITSIENEKTNKNKCNVYIDNRYAFSADYEDIIEFKIKENISITEEEFMELIFKCQYKKAFNRSIKLLSIRARSENEIRDDLSKYGFDNNIIDRVLAKLEEYKYIDDTEFSKQWIERRMNLNPQGIRKIVDELKGKGINHQIIDEAILQSKIDDLNTAINLLKKKINKSNIDKDREAVYKKMYRYLLYRGIDYETAKKAINFCFDRDKEME